jgi:hypothetical protein
MSSCIARDNTDRSSSDECAPASIASRPRLGSKPTPSHLCADAAARITTLPHQARISQQAVPVGVAFKVASVSHPAAVGSEAIGHQRALIADSKPLLTPSRLAAGVLAVFATSAILAFIDVLTRSP